MRGFQALVPLALAATPNIAITQAAQCAPPPVAVSTTPTNGSRMIVVPTRPPCSIVVRPTSVQLRADEGGTIEGIGRSVARFASGEYATAFRERIQFWSATGRPLGQHGQRGAGPGEMSIGTKQLFTRADTLWIRDGFLLHAMLPSGRVIGSVKVTAPMQGMEGTVLLDDGRLLTVGVSGSAGNQFHLTRLVLSQKGNQEQPISFGPLGRDERSAATDAQRALGYNGGQTFWAGSLWLPATGYYEIEQWSTEGRLLQRLRRTASWFLGGTSGARSPADRPPPAIPVAHLDSSGYLWVVAVTPTARWSPTARMDSTMEVRLDAIRLSDGLLVATLGPVLYRDALATLPSSFFPGSRHGVRIEENEVDGLPLARVVELWLESRR